MIKLFICLLLSLISLTKQEEAATEEDEKPTIEYVPVRMSAWLKNRGNQMNELRLKNLESQLMETRSQMQIGQFEQNYREQLNKLKTKMEKMMERKLENIKIKQGLDDAYKKYREYQIRPRVPPRTELTQKSMQYPPVYINQRESEASPSSSIDIPVIDLLGGKETKNSKDQELLPDLPILSGLIGGSDKDKSKTGGVVGGIL